VDLYRPPRSDASGNEILFEEILRGGEMKPKIIQENDKETLIQCTCLRHTAKAIMVEGVNDSEVWLPRSQIEVVQDEETFVELLIPNWLLEKHPLC